MKTILYRLLKLGAVPGELLPVLEQEGIVEFDEGMTGRFVCRHVDAPKKRYRNRSEGFYGCLVLTKQRLLLCTFSRRQINISLDDDRISQLYIEQPQAGVLSISFESSVFREGWQGVIEFTLKTEKAGYFLDALLSIGAQQATASA